KACELTRRNRFCPRHFGHFLLFSWRGNPRLKRRLNHGNCLHAILFCDSAISRLLVLWQHLKSQLHVGGKSWKDFLLRYGLFALEKRDPCREGKCQRDQHCPNGDQKKTIAHSTSQQQGTRLTQNPARG